jgi:anti-sigma regulatory factor (Ser/Thr protein kinase)
MAETQSRRAHSFCRRPIAENRGCRQRLTVEWCMLTEIEAISPLVDRLMPLVRESQCVPGEEQDVELALREALGNAVVRGNQQDARRKVHDPLPVQVAPSAVHLGEGRRKRIQLEAQGISAGSTDSEHGRGILLMNAYMDGVRYSRGGSEVRMYKRVRSIQ